MRSYTARPIGRVFVQMLACVVLAGGAAMAHTALKSSDPARGSRLTVVPHRLRLEFTEPTELSTSRFVLLGPDSAEVTLAALAHPVDSARIIVADITGTLRAGAYTVRWQAGGRDGHPARGEFGFLIDSGAIGL